MQLGGVFIFLGAVTVSLALTIAPNCTAPTNNLTCLILGDDAMANQPEDTSNLDCSDYAHILTPAQMDLCVRGDKNYVPCMALGIKRAIQWCRKVLKDELWNCTKVVGDYVLGKIVHQYPTRERAVVVAMVTAAITIDIATCCREEKLKDCPCDTPPYERKEGKDEEGGRTVTYGECGDNVNKAKERADQIMGVTSDAATVEDRVDYHNAALGAKLGMKTEEVCRCHGITGSCNVKTCKMKTRDYEVIAQDMPARYKSASAVTLTNSQLVSVGPADDPTSNDLVYSCDTPYTCNRDEDLGIPGTSGRECNPTDNTASNSCDRLCCGRGHYEVTKRVPVEDCVFVFCCRFDCTVVRYESETKYYCR